MVWIEVDNCWYCDGEGFVEEDVEERLDVDVDCSEKCWYCQGSGEA